MQGASLRRISQLEHDKSPIESRVSDSLTRNGRIGLSNLTPSIASTSLIEGVERVTRVERVPVACKLKNELRPMRKAASARLILNSGEK
jgi:hypothetical protein